MDIGNISTTQSAEYIRMIGDTDDHTDEHTTSSVDGESDDLLAIKQRVESIAMSMDQMNYKMPSKVGDLKKTPDRMDSFVTSMQEMATEISTMSGMLTKSLRTVSSVQAQNEKLLQMVQTLVHDMEQRNGRKTASSKQKKIRMPRSRANKVVRAKTARNDDIEDHIVSTSVVSDGESGESSVHSLFV